MNSEHFSDKELACHHCGVNLCTPSLLAALEAFRAAVGKPVHVNDAYRCAIHNKAVGGAPNSQHVLGNAADIRVAGMTAVELYAIAERIMLIRGVGRADHQGYIHVDVRMVPAKWCYDANGKEMPWYEPKEVIA